MIRKMEADDHDKLIELIAQFQVTMSRFQGRAKAPDLNAAEDDLDGYNLPNVRVFVAEVDDKELAGFLVCRIGDDVIYAESLFVLAENRRQGVGSALYSEAERLLEELQLGSLHNWVQPNNDRMIGFLRKRGYSVLDKIEVRRIRQGESFMQRIKVGKNAFDYSA
jgi:ribosomal protein S18 acetylase RimI-like enzyme